MIFVAHKLGAQYLLSHSDNNGVYFCGSNLHQNLLMSMITCFPYKDYVIYYLMDKTYITCLADVLIIGSILACYGSFSASHYLFEQKKNEVIASGDLNIRSSIFKVKLYLVLSIVFNFLVVTTVLWIFWPVDFFLLFLLCYKVSLNWGKINQGVQSLICGLVRVSDLRISMRQIEGVNAIDNSIFLEHKAKYTFRSLDLLLDVIYAMLIFRHGEYVLASFTIAFFGTSCIITIISKGWNLLTEYKEFKKFERTIRVTMQEYSFEEGKEEDCGICMEKMKTARKLRCGHCFHQFCLMQMILNKKTTCPICRLDIYGDQPRTDQRAANRARREEIRRDNQRPEQQLNQRPEMQLNHNLIGNLMQNMFMPFMGGRNAPMVGEADIARVQEVYPNMTRDQVVQEILRYGGVEQAILAIAERLQGLFEFMYACIVHDKQWYMKYYRQSMQSFKEEVSWKLILVFQYFLVVLRLLKFPDYKKYPLVWKWQ
eukprot:TRINITY_DN141_c1_g1_i1.p2 TRINITY_DN141_c1_g1~~TRINITY_DN141_c1_g1_i1.p2  ORF type:complete len:484 (+),score=14.65 TRINITY_DN141_c1_g1_i1:382-1833(+)